MRYSILSQEEWSAVRSLANDRSIAIKEPDKGSCFVVWDRWDYKKEAEKQLEDSTVIRKSIIIRTFFLSWLTQVINSLRNLTVVVIFLIRK